MFDAMDAVFILINRYNLIRASHIRFTTILGSIGVGKSARTPLTMLVVPVIFSCTLGGIDGGFVPCDNLCNMLKR